MDLRESVTIGDTTLCVGDKLQANEHAEKQNICITDEIVEIKAIKHTDGLDRIGLHSDKKHTAWGSLDRLTTPYHGFWCNAKETIKLFNKICDEKVVAGDFNFKNRNLKGMKCKVLYQNPKQGQSFVEFGDNVGGGGADGLGRTGHCVAISSSLLENINDDKTSKTKAKKKVAEGVIEQLEADVPEIAVKAKIVTKYANKEGTDKYHPIDAGWEKMQKDLWSIGNQPEFKKDFVMEWRIGNASKDTPIEVVANNYIDSGQEPDFHDES